MTRYRFPQDREFSVLSGSCLHRFPSNTSASSSGSESINPVALMLAGPGSSRRVETVTASSRTGTTEALRTRSRTKMLWPPSRSTLVQAESGQLTTSATTRTSRVPEVCASIVGVATRATCASRRTWETPKRQSSRAGSASSQSGVLKATNSTRPTPAGKFDADTSSGTARRACVNAAGNGVTERLDPVRRRTRSGTGTPQCALGVTTTRSPRSSSLRRVNATAARAVRKTAGKGVSLGGDLRD